MNYLVFVYLIFTIIHYRLSIGIIICSKKLIFFGNLKLKLIINYLLVDEFYGYFLSTLNINYAIIV